MADFSAFADMMPFAVASGVEITAAGPDEVDGRLDWAPERCTSAGVLHGGALFVAAATFGSELTDGVEYAWKHGAVAVVASGNDGLFGAGIGSSEYGNMDALVVGATGHDGKTADYSSPTGNAKWAVLAPGGSNHQTESDDIYSTIWKKGKVNSYGYLAGTSMATPHVTGAVALLLAQGLTKEQAVEKVLATADTVPCGANSEHCRGRLNVARATGAKL